MEGLPRRSVVTSDEYEKEENHAWTNIWIDNFSRQIFMTSVVTGRPICVVVVLFMLSLGVCLHMTQCLVVDGHSELIMVITPARHLAYSGGGAPLTG